MSLGYQIKLKMSVTDLNFVAEPHEDFVCPICAKVLVEPHVTECAVDNISVNSVWASGSRSKVGQYVLTADV